MKEKTTVLIADDNQEFSRTLASYIQEQPDLEVIGIAKDGEEAIDMITNIEPDIALLDVIMPHLDGIGVLEKINMIKNAIHELDIGDDFLYDNGKYFTRSYNYKREPLIDYKKDCFVYNDVFHMRDMFPNNHDGMLTYEQYLEDYLYFKFEKDEETQKKKTILKPNDYLINVEELMRREEKKVCYWIMIMVENVIRFSIRYLNYKMKEHDSTDAIFSTYEDKYFSILYDLYYLQKNE